MRGPAGRAGTPDPGARSPRHPRLAPTTCPRCCLGRRSGWQVQHPLRPRAGLPLQASLRAQHPPAGLPLLLLSLQPDFSGKQRIETLFFVCGCPPRSPPCSPPAEPCRLPLDSRGAAQGVGPQHALHLLPHLAGAAADAGGPRSPPGAELVWEPEFALRNDHKQGGLDGWGFIVSQVLRPGAGGPDASRVVPYRDSVPCLSRGLWGPSATAGVPGHLSLDLMPSA